MRRADLSPIHHVRADAAHRFRIDVVPLRVALRGIEAVDHQRVDEEDFRAHLARVIDDRHRMQLHAGAAQHPARRSDATNPRYFTLWRS